MDDSDSDDSPVLALKKKKRAPAAKGGKKKKPSMDALFKLNWWRIVLGMFGQMGCNSAAVLT